MTKEERLHFAVGVLARLHEGVFPQRRNVHCGSWQPVPHYCHNNVATWVSGNPSHKHVFGFAVFGPTNTGFGYWRVAAHSVVEMEDGTLVDITPHEARGHPFIRHNGSTEEFVAMAEEMETIVPVVVAEFLLNEGKAA